MPARFGSDLSRALRIALIVQALAATPALAKVVLVVEESASIYSRASQGFLLGFASADAIDTVVGRVLDHLGVPHDLLKRWGEKS